MLTEQDAIAAASQFLQQSIPEAEVEGVYAFTHDNGLTWMVHFRPVPHEEVNEETGITTVSVSSPGTWAIVVTGEPGQARWPKMH